MSMSTETRVSPRPAECDSEPGKRIVLNYILGDTGILFCFQNSYKCRAFFKFSSFFFGWDIPANSGAPTDLVFWATSGSAWGTVC